jgi:hypothetical protein
MSLYISGCKCGAVLSSLRRVEDFQKLRQEYFNLFPSLVQKRAKRVLLSALLSEMRPYTRASSSFTGTCSNLLKGISKVSATRRQTLPLVRGNFRSLTISGMKVLGEPYLRPCTCWSSELWSLISFSSLNGARMQGIFQLPMEEADSICIQPSTPFSWGKHEAGDSIEKQEIQKQPPKDSRKGIKLSAPTSSWGAIGPSELLSLWASVKPMPGFL